MRESLRQGDPCVHYAGLRHRDGDATRPPNALAPALREGRNMGQKTVRFSDLSGQLIMQDDALARIVIHEHPELGDGPVEIEVLADEAKVIEKAALRVAMVDIYLPGEDEPRRVAMDAAAFDKLA